MVSDKKGGSEAAFCLVAGVVVSRRDGREGHIVVVEAPVAKGGVHRARILSKDFLHAPPKRDDID